MYTLEFTRFRSVGCEIRLPRWGLMSPSRCGMQPGKISAGGSSAVAPCQSSELGRRHPPDQCCQLHRYVVSKRGRHHSKKLNGYAREKSSSQTDSVVRHTDELTNDVDTVNQLRPCRSCVFQRLVILQMSTDGLGARHARARRRPFTGRVPSSTWRVWS